MNRSALPTAAPSLGTPDSHPDQDGHAIVSSGEKTRGGFFHHYGPWLALLLIIGLFASIRWRLREVPLERDEGEYAYAGQLLRQGIPPYQFAYNMKLPGTYAAYAGLMSLLGETPAGIHLGLLLVNAITTCLLFGLARQWFSPWAGATAAAAFAMLSASPSVMGLAAHANHFVVLCAVGGLLLLPREGSGSITQSLGSGLLFGLALMMKQHGALFGIFGGIWLVAMELKVRPFVGGRVVKKLGWFSAGFFAPLILTGWALWLSGVFARFWYWTVTYAWSYASAGNWQIGWKRFPECLAEATVGNQMLWGIAGLGLVAVWCDRRWHRAAFFLSGWLLVSLASVWPGFVFRPHYFILMLPVLALLIGAVVHWGWNLPGNRIWPRLMRWVGPLVFLGALGWTGFQHREVFFRVSPQEHAAMMHEDNPFVEAEAVARYIRLNSTPDARIAVVGSEPQIYFLSHRRSATGYIYTYALMEPHPHALDMQREMIREIEEAKPEYIVFIGFTFSWLPQPDSSMLIFHWLDQFTPQFYDKVGLIDYGIDSVWGASAAEYSPQSKQTISVYRRRPQG